MKERPIIFSSPMVRAILEDRKRMTRRIIKAPMWSRPDMAGVDYPCPYGGPEDRLWVKETFATTSIGGAKEDFVHYRSTPDRGRFLSSKYGWEEEMTIPWVNKWTPSIFMPHWASRLTLEITDIKVERLQQINGEDANAEGFIGDYSKDEEGIKGEITSPEEKFAQYWEFLHGKESWEKNPWVWAISFNKLGRFGAVGQKNDEK